jgi:hypothetical protein
MAHGKHFKTSGFYELPVSVKMISFYATNWEALLNANINVN